MTATGEHSPPAPRRRRFGLLAGVAAAAVAAAQWLAAEASAQTAVTPALKLRVVGGLASINQYTRHEEPFWSRRLAEVSAGRYTADIVPFDRAGIRAQEMLPLIQRGAVAFGTSLLALGPAKDLDLVAPDLAGLNPDMASLRRSVAAFRPYLESTLRDRYGIEPLAVYTYPAQVVFCNKPWTGLDGLKGRRVRTSSATQSDWVEALGATPVLTPFAEILTNLRAGSIDCAITGTMSGNTIGLDTLTTHLHPMAISWGLAIFAAHGPTWAALPPDLKALLRRELPRLERAIWDEADRDTADGVACNTGDARCQTGRRGAMAALPATAADEARRRELFARHVLPQWLRRCGPVCVDVWNRTLAPVAGVPARGE